MNKPISIVFLVTTLLFSCQKQQEPEPEKANIIFILADDLGYGDLGCYGQRQIQTPYLDMLADEGIMFTQHYAGSTVCAPSRCSLITGLHSGHSLIRGNATLPLQKKSVTVAKLVKEAGYRTALIGKWGLGEAGSTGIPNEQGFDYFFGYLNQVRAHNYYPEFLWRNQEKVMLENEVVKMPDGYAKGVGSAATKKVDYSHDLFSQEAINFIEQSADTSFFLYLAYTIPHANNEHHLIDEHGMEVPDYGMYADKNWPEPQKGLAAMITRMDGDIGKIKLKLEELGIDKNTLVIFSSDNGPHAEGMNNPDFFNSNGPLRGLKRDLYDGGIRVPLIAWWPETIESGQTTDHISAFWDFMPTACEIAGVTVPEGIDGISYLPVLKGDTQPKHDHLYWEFYEQGGKQAVRKDYWKGVRLSMSNNAEAPIELYNLQNDISEENNIAARHPEMVQKMDSIMKAAHRPSEHFTFNFEKNEQ